MGEWLNKSWNNNNNKEWIIDMPNNLDEFQGNYINWKKLVPKDYIHDSIYITFGNNKTTDMEHRLAVARD